MWFWFITNLKKYQKLEKFSFTMALRTQRKNLTWRRYWSELWLKYLSPVNSGYYFRQWYMIFLSNPTEVESFIINLLPMLDKVTHCPGCHKPALNNGQFFGSAQFKIKCSWCSSTLLVKVQPKVTAELVEDSINKIKKKTLTSFARLASQKKVTHNSPH